MGEKLHSMMVSAEERALISARRKDQGPELPTEPYTVIKVEWRDVSDETNPVLMRFPPEWYGEWGWSDGDDYGDADRLRREIIGFEVLAKPHAEGVPTDTGMSHETFAETYPNEVQFHYDGGFADGAKAALTRVREEFVLYMDQDRRLGELDAEFGVEQQPAAEA